jgi:hypothetical protein
VVIGQPVPPSVTLYPVPEDVYPLPEEAYPLPEEAYPVQEPTPYAYAVVNDQHVIVDPRTRVILDIAQ